MADKQGPENSEGSQTQPNSASTNADFDIGGNVDGNITVGNNNVVNNNIVNNYYQQEVKKNTEKHEPDYWALKHPYPMPPNFTGRIAERAILTHWLKEDSENRLFILRALGGFGKSALTWHWLTHDVDIKEYPKVVFWSFYEGDASFEHFIEETLKYLKLEVPQGQRPQVDELLKAMQGGKILLIMDGFERALRAYSSMNAAYQGDDPKVEDNQLDCVNINAEIFLKSVCSLPNLKSKILMTTRLTPRAVKSRGELMLGCREEKLEAMQKDDAVEFFRKQKIKGTHSEIEAACASYGHHPLSLRILAGLIANDRRAPGDISVAKNLEITKDIIQNKHHILETAFNTLSASQKKLLGRIACFRAPMFYDALKTIHGTGKGNDFFDDSLKALESRGLLHWDRKTNKYDLHPIVRRYAYERLTTSDRITSHTRLIIYFEVVQKPETIEMLEDLAPVIELYHHTVKAGQFDTAWALFRDRIWQSLYYHIGGYQTQIELLTALFIDGEDHPPKLKQESNQGHCLNELANAYSANGQSRRAVPLFKVYISISEKLNDKNNTAIGLGNLAICQSSIGALKDVELSLQRAIELDKELDSAYDEACDNRELGYMLIFRGEWSDSELKLETAKKLFEKEGNEQSLSLTWLYFAWRFLLLARTIPQFKKVNLKSAIAAASRALSLANEWTRKHFSMPSGYIRSYWVLGAALRANGDLAIAEENLSKAISICRQINMVYFEADILLELARLRYDQKKTEEAKSLAEEALSITERCGYVLQGADVNLFIAQYALEQEKDKTKAKEYAETALKLATCDGPPYYYKVAYEEAARMLEKL